MRPPTALITVAIALIAAGTATAQNANEAAPTVKDVMATKKVPASDDIFDAASEPPKDDAQWVALHTVAPRTNGNGSIHK